MLALKGPSREAQGGGARDSGVRNPGCRIDLIQALKGRRRMHRVWNCVAPSGLSHWPTRPRAPAGFAASALGFAAPRFQRFASWRVNYRFDCYRPLAGGAMRPPMFKVRRPGQFWAIFAAS